MVAFAVATACAAARRWQAALRRTLSGTFVGVGALMAAMYLMTLRANAGHSDPHTVRMGPGTLVWPLLIGLVLGIAVALLTPASLPRGDDHPATSPADLPRTALRRGQRAVLTAGVGRMSPLVSGTLVELVVLAVVMYRVAGVGAGAVIPIVVVAVSMVAALGLSLQVDRHGVRVLLLGLPWPIARARLAEIESAEALDLRPMEWGGWGYRLTPHGRAVILRGGPGLVGHLNDGNHLAVSTDAAEQAAELVNGLVTQLGSGTSADPPGR